jgi:GNAT superfamily N-acetyltransferase
VTAPSIRAATPDDAEAISAVRLAGWRAAYGALLPPGKLDHVDGVEWAARVRARLATGQTVMLVAEDAGSVQAFSSFGCCRDHDLPEADEIYALYVHPTQWSRGLGRELMAATLPQLRRPVALWVLEANARARRFYEIAGFRADGSVKDADLYGATLPEVRYILRYAPGRREASA